VLFNDTILHNIKYGRVDATMDEVSTVLYSPLLSSISLSVSLF
jgi:ABC-type transport system involved in Fe-S cluster assembly fused permease/ATPase subunit